jgi:hypothetical protein
MGMFLMLLGLALVVAASQAVILAYLWRESRNAAAPAIDAADVVGPPQFFQASIGRSAQASPGSARVPLLLQRLEQHIRLEQAAAESFHQFPTAAALHKHTASPLLH